jgi:aspartyl-tRNA(Asn)/glutamyl-tRNA(Gln) amidotransferase subunit A
MEKSEIPFLSLTQLSAQIRSREVSPVEVVEAYLERIDRLNDRLHAFITVCREEALAAARQAEHALARGELLGAMHGIPVAGKDQLYSAGIRTTFGSPIFNDFVPDEDATVIARLKAAGAILIGKLNMTEFGTTGVSHSFATARNPWNLERYTGGSSSGSGGATAGFLCATSLGEDTGGSVRWPASWCGLVGLRPTWGRVSRYGLRPGVWSMDTIGPLSRTVEDCAITLQAIAGHDPKDPYTWDVPVPDYRAALEGDIKGVRVGVVREMLYHDVVEPKVRDAVSRAIDVLSELGASVEEVSIPLSKDAWTISPALRVDPPMNNRDLLQNRLREIGHDNRIGYLTEAILPAQAYYKAQKLAVLVRQQVHEALDRYDVLVFPTSGRTAPARVEDDPIFTSKEGAARIPFMFNNTANLANAPGISVPCGFSPDGMPVGLQVMGKPFAEEMVFKVAHAYEQATPWHTMRPPSV